MKLSELEVLNLHAQGGMAEVYRARVVGSDGGEQIYAVKKILPHFTKDQELVRMFVEEARVAACLNHPNVVQVFDLVMSEQGEYFIVMEFADGKDLADLIYYASQQKKLLPPALAVLVARDTLRALDYAHKATDAEGRPLRLIHRDISPHNIIITFDGKVKLTDFGIAKVQASANKTMAGVIKGKFGYMSPEQARGRPLDHRSDLFNVGIVLFEAITGERLFAGSSDLSTLDRMRTAEVPRLPAALGCPPELEGLIRRTLEKDPALRPQDASLFERELVNIAERAGLVPSAAEAASIMREVFRDELKQREKQPRQTRHVELKSQMFKPGELSAAAAPRPPSPGAAAKVERARPPPPPTPPPERLHDETVDVVPTAPPPPPRGSQPQRRAFAPGSVPSTGAGVKAGGGARALDGIDALPSRPGSSAAAAEGTRPEVALPRSRANATRVEHLSSSPSRGNGDDAADDDGEVVVAASAQVRALPPNASGDRPPSKARAAAAANDGRPLSASGPRAAAVAPVKQKQPSKPELAAAAVQRAAAAAPQTAEISDPGLHARPTGILSATAPPPPLATAPPPPMAYPGPPPPPMLGGPPPPPALLVPPSPPSISRAPSDGQLPRPPPPPPAALPPSPPPVASSAPPPVPSNPAVRNDQIPSGEASNPGAEYPAQPVSTEIPQGGLQPIPSSLGPSSSSSLPPVAAPSPAPAPKAPPSVRAPAGPHFLDAWLPGTAARIAASCVLVAALALGFFAAIAGRSFLDEEPADLRTLMIRSNPPGAAVLIDGERAGVTPLVVDVRLADGAHTLKINVTNGPSSQRKITLKRSDRTLVISENLATAGRVEVSTWPAGARLLLDGAEIGLSPLSLEKVTTDKAHIVEARLEGYLAATGTIPISRADLHRITLVLQSTRADGQIVVHSTPEAELLMDGQPWGKSGDAVRNCPPGQHEVTLRAPGVTPPPTFTIVVPETGVGRYHFDLRTTL